MKWPARLNPRANPERVKLQSVPVVLYEPWHNLEAKDYYPYTITGLKGI